MSKWHITKKEFEARNRSEMIIKGSEFVFELTRELYHSTRENSLESLFKLWDKSRVWIKEADNFLIESAKNLVKEVDKMNLSDKAIREVYETALMWRVVADFVVKFPNEIGKLYEGM